jgi:S-adenosyl methyltransferase
VDNGDVPQEIDTSKPHTARIYDYFLGGKDNFAADREVAKQALKVAPAMLTAVRENRAFLGRAVRYLAEEAGITQFLDLGSGLPSVGNVHEVAQDVNPAARVVYVDNDAIVLAHGRALLISKPEGKCAYLHADIKDPRYILRHPITRATLDFGEPVALILNAVLHFFADEEEPGNIVQTVVDALPSGSYVVASHGTAEYSPPLKVDGGVCAYQQGGMPVRLRDGDEFADLAFTGLTLVPPGVVVVSEWHPEPGAIPLPAGEVGINGAVARKPLCATGLPVHVQRGAALPLPGHFSPCAVFPDDSPDGP